MENKDKIELLLDMMEHPERYSEEETERLLDDEECRAAYEMAVKAAQGYDHRRSENSLTEQDIDREWRRFEAQHYPRRTAWWRSKVAAATIGVVMVSGLTIAAIHTGLLSGGKQNTETVEAAPADTTAAMPSGAKELATEAPEPRQFENVRLEDVLTEIATYYNIKVEFRSDEAKDVRLYLRWNPQDGAEKAVETIDAFSKVRVEMADGVITVE